MSATLIEPSPATAPARQEGALTKVQKLAALLVMVGPENASLILREFQPREIEAISREMANFALITREQQQEILEDFSDVALTASTGVCAGVDITRATLEKALGTFKASDVLGRILPSRPALSGMQAISEMDSRHIFNLIRDEQPQTIAFVISHLAPDKGAQVLGLLKPEQRDGIVERLARLGPTPVEVAEKVIEVLNAKRGVKQTRALTQTGGVTTAADVLNATDKTLSRTLLTSIEQRDPELCQAIRKKMFTFEDLLRFSSQSIQRIMREVDIREITLALKKSSEPLRKLLLSSVSRRAAEAVQEELALLRNVKAREVEAAQFKIVDAVRRLEAEGEIEMEEEAEVGYEMV
jgi:flagellar motor switch protein FliG